MILRIEIQYSSDKKNGMIMINTPILFENGYMVFLA